MIIESSQAHPTHVGALSSRTTRVRIRAVIQHHRRRPAVKQCWSSRRLSTSRHSLLASSCPRCGFPPPSRSAYQDTCTWTSTGLPRSAGVRRDRGGPLLYPGAAVSSRPAGRNRAAPAASQRPALHPRFCNPPAREVLTRHPRRFTLLARPIFPLPVPPGRNGKPSALPPGFTPRRYQRRMPGWEQVSRTLTRSYIFDISRTSNA